MKHDNLPRPEIIVAGAGWSGLAAAARLCQHGFPVKLIEASACPGGRARNITINNRTLDNGQHILLGAYKHVLKLLRLVDINETDVLLRHPLYLDIHSTTDQGIQIKTRNLPAPLHMISAILKSRGLSVYEKILLLRAMLSFRISNFRVSPDISVSQLLQQHKQTPRIIKLFWEPVCVAALNTNIDKASAHVLLQVFKKSFTGNRRNSDFLLPRTGLGELVPLKATEYINNHHGKVIFKERITRLLFDKHGIQAVKTNQGQYTCQHLILALPFKQSLKLLEEYDDLNQQLKSYPVEYEPVTTLYLQYAEDITLKNNIIGTVDTTAQWLIDRRSCGQPGLMAAVISASGPHQRLDKETLTRQVIDEISTLFPDWPEPQETWLTREKQATFTCHYKTNHLRPSRQALGKNIWLAGDFLDHNLPATLEAAVQAGLQCADQLVKQFKRT